MTQPTRTPRRWLQFSLRTLLVLMLLVAAFFGGRESMRPAIRAEREKALQAQATAEKERAQAQLAAAQVAMARFMVLEQEATSQYQLKNQPNRNVAPQTDSKSQEHPICPEVLGGFYLLQVEPFNAKTPRCKERNVAVFALDGKNHPSEPALLPVCPGHDH